MERINKQKVYNFYSRKNKWLGLIDYKTLLFCVIYVFIVFKIICLFNISYITKIYIVANLLLPLIIFILFNLKEESIIDKLKAKDNFIKTENRCTMCYRCVNICPKQAITLLGKHVVMQGTIEKYL